MSIGGICSFVKGYPWAIPGGGIPPTWGVVSHITYYHTSPGKEHKMSVYTCKEITPAGEVLRDVARSFSRRAQERYESLDSWDDPIADAMANVDSFIRLVIREDERLSKTIAGCSSCGTHYEYYKHEHCPNPDCYKGYDL